MSTMQVAKVHTFLGHKDSIYTIESMDDQPVFFTGAGDGMVVKWDFNQPNQGQLIAQMQNSVYALQSIAERNLLAVGHNFQGIHLIDLSQNKEVGSLALNNAAIFDMEWTGDQLLVATGSGPVYVVGVDQLQVHKVLEFSDKSARCISVYREREEFAVGYSDHSIRVFDLKNYRLKFQLNGHTNSVFTISYHPRQQMLISAGRDAHIRTWDPVRDYAQNQSIAAHMYAINHIEFSPNGQHFVTCSMDKSIKVWDAHEFKLLKVIDKARHEGHGTSVNKLYWSRYNQLLVSCSDDRTISVWDLKF